MQTFKTTIKGITCKACVMLITMELEEQDGIGNISIDSHSGDTVIEYDEKQITPGDIIATIENTGDKKFSV